jgi:hypothetical protein
MGYTRRVAGDDAERSAAHAPGRITVVRPSADVTSIEATLRLSPVERLRQNDRMVNMAARLRDAFAKRDGRTG